MRWGDLVALSQKQVSEGARFICRGVAARINTVQLVASTGTQALWSQLYTWGKSVETPPSYPEPGNTSVFISYVRMPCITFGFSYLNHASIMIFYLQSAYMRPHISYLHSLLQRPDWLIITSMYTTYPEISLYMKKKKTFHLASN